MADYYQTMQDLLRCLADRLDPTTAGLLRGELIAGDHRDLENDLIVALRGVPLRQSEVDLFRLAVPDRPDLPVAAPRRPVEFVSDLPGPTELDRAVVAAVNGHPAVRRVLRAWRTASADLPAAAAYLVVVEAGLDTTDPTQSPTSFALGESWVEVAAEDDDLPPYFAALHASAVQLWPSAG